MKTTVLYLFTSAALALMVMLLPSCTSSETMKSGNSEADKVLSFYYYEDGHRNLYEAGFKDNEIISITKNGKEIPASEFKSLENLVYENIEQLRGDSPLKKEFFARPLKINKEKLFRIDEDATKDDLIWIDKNPAKKKKIFMFKNADSLLMGEDDEDMHFFNFRMDDSDFVWKGFSGPMKFHMHGESDSCCRKHPFMHHFEFDRDEFKQNMKEFKKQMKENQAYIFKFKDDMLSDSSFKNDMKKMKIELQKLKDHKIKIKVDSDKLKADLEKMKEELSETNLNEHLKKLKVHVRRMTDDLKDMDVDEIEIEVPEIEIEIESLNDELSELNEESAEIKIEMKNLDNFTKELKKQLYKDGITKSEDEDISISLSSDKISVNGKDLPPGRLNKYKDLYKKHFGKEIGDKEHFEIEED